MSEIKSFSDYTSKYNSGVGAHPAFRTFNPQDINPSIKASDNLSRALAAIPEEEKEGTSELIKNLVIGLE